jgi:hypothetical protein
MNELTEMYKREEIIKISLMEELEKERALVSEMRTKLKV